jgi:hypothetical protein
MTPSRGIIQNHDRLRTLQREREYRGLSGAEIRGESQDRFTARRAKVYPGQGFGHRQIEAQPAAFGQLGGDRGRHDDPRHQARQQVQPANLVEVLERGGITNDVRRGAPDAPVRRR